MNKSPGFLSFPDSRDKLLRTSDWNYIHFTLPAKLIMRRHSFLPQRTARVRKKLASSCDHIMAGLLSVIIMPSYAHGWK